MTVRTRAIHLGAFLATFLVAGAARGDLISRWNFDGDLLDSEAAGNHGTFVGNPAPVFVEGRDGTPNGAISFDGVDDYVTLPQGAGLPIHGEPAFSITVWVKGVMQADKRIFSEASTTSGTPLFNIGTDNTAIATNTGVTSIFIRSDANTAVVNHRKSVRQTFDDTWHHLAWVDDNGTASLYVDGLLQPTNYNYVRPALTTNTSTFGAILRAAAGSFFAGAIDDARIFNHALSEAEVHEVIESPDCPADGDTTCSNLLVDGPPDNGVGTYTLTATGDDDSGDMDLLYTFVADNGEGTTLTRGPQTSDTATFPLTPGTWTLSSTVDDTLFCFDSRAEDTCMQTVEIEAPPMLVSRWKFDGDVLDSEPAMNHGTFVGDAAPMFTEGFDGMPDSAILLDGVDDYVAVTQNAGLPIQINEAYTLAAWVKGLPQMDRRVFAEGSSTTNTPLWGLATQSTGATSQVDMFIRNDANVTTVNHRLSGRDAFDGSWHHVAWVDDNGQGVLYIDGVRDSGDFRYTRAPLTLDRTAIGAVLRAAAGNFYAGAIDDVRVYNYALTPGEVSDLVPEFADCAADMDTHCTGISVAGPARGGPGIHTATATGADDSGDPILYTFVLSDSEGNFLRQVGPQTAATADFELNKGMYDITVTVDDIIRCKDVADDASCSTSVTVEDAPPILISHWSFDGDLLDPISGNDGTFVGKDAPPFRPGYDCTEDGALQFDGAVDYVVVAQTQDLPISRKEAFSVAMWVKGPPQGDRRVFSESSTAASAQLFNIGTDNTGATGAVDIFIRNDANAALVNHVHSTGIAFDDTWHHIAYTDDNGTAKLYIDGVLDPANFNYVRGTLTLNTTTIGGILRATSCCWFKGRIDDVRLYNYALEEDEVTEIIGSGPGECCPEVGDTHCLGLTVMGPAGDGPGEYTAQASASDDSGDAVSYTFTASNGVDEPMVIGPQAADSATFMIGGAPGSTTVWTFTVEVDDDPTCPDVSGDAVCSAEKTVIVCPDEGDTHCQGLVVTGPAGGGPGVHLAEASAADDSGDAIQYTFTASNGVDTPVVIGPQPDASASFDLGVATWTISVVVDDDPACGDAATDASCEETVVVEDPRVGPFVRGNSNADQRVDIADVVFILNWLFRGGLVPPCIAAANASSTESVDVASAIYILHFLFLGGSPPGAPFPGCGLSTDPFDVALGCESFPPCE
ncbi:MAG TPA: LamG-like jellyroll fold domain-containing protein [Planctomycetota bacterium]|nr:LamG-like jellyroll fold domain-containing protein [Planctomycetota bacterium]